MASETMALETPLQEESSLRTLFPETIPSATGNPVDVIIALRKDMAEFQKVSSKEALREKLRKELRAACKEALQRGTADCPNGYPDIEPIVEYLRERGVIRPKLSRAQIRRLKAALPPNERDKI
jgi:hypothetical protein